VRRFRSAIILAIVLLALGGLATWDEWQTKKDDETKKTENLLTTIKPADVVEMRFESTGGAADAPVEGEAPPPAPTAPVRASAVKRDGVWQLIEPVTVQGDDASITNLLTTVLDYSIAKVVAEDKSKWADFGVDAPQRTIWVKTGGDKPQEMTVYVGNKAPVGYNVYLRTSKDDKVYVGSQHLLASTSKSLFELRDKTVAKFDPKSITRFTYAHAGQPAIEMIKDGTNWTITKPEPVAADSAEIRDYIEEVARVKAVGFVDDPAEKDLTAFKSPGTEIRLTDDKGAVTTVLLKEIGGKLLATTVPPARLAELGDEWKGKLAKSLADFRNRRIFVAAEMDATTLKIDGDTYERNGGDWFKAGDAEKKSINHLRAFLVDLEFAKTDEFLPLDGVLAAKLAAPLHRITLAPKQGPEIVVDVYTDAEKDDRYLVRRTGGAHLYRIPKSAFNSMTPPPPVQDAEPGAEGAPGLEDEGLNLEDIEDLSTEDLPEGAG
jgi:hypothetical protein